MPTGTPLAAKSVPSLWETAMNGKQSWALVKETGSAWVADRAPSMGAALSYYTVFSIAPLLLIVVAVAGLVFSTEAAQGAIVGQLQGLLGEKAAQTIQGLLQSVSRPREGVVATLIGLVLLLMGATTVFAELQDDLDRIWHAPQRAKPTGAWGWLRSRILSFGLICGFGFLLLVSLVASAAIAALGHWWDGLFGGWELLAQGVNFVVSYVLVTAMFAFIYRFMPHVRVEWHDVWIGAAVTALLFTVGKQLIGLYLGKSSVVSGFGAAGSLAVLLLWVYYSAQIFLFGAEFTRAFAHAFGSRRAKAQAEVAALATTSPYPEPVPAQAAAAVAGMPAADRRGRVRGVRERQFGKLATGVQRHLVPALGAAAALGAIVAWTVSTLRGGATARTSQTAHRSG
jgi:membrane protein